MRVFVIVGVLYTLATLALVGGLSLAVAVYAGAIGNGDLGGGAAFAFGLLVAAGGLGLLLLACILHLVALKKKRRTPPAE